MAKQQKEGKNSEFIDYMVEKTKKQEPKATPYKPKIKTKEDPKTEPYKGSGLNTEHIKGLVNKIKEKLADKIKK
jgi:hypothetical protein